MNYFLMSYPNDPQLGIAKAPSNIDEFIFQVEQKPVLPELEFIIETGNTADFQGSDVAWRLCSLKLRNVIEKISSYTDKKSMFWYETNIHLPDNNSLTYYILNLLGDDVLNKAKTVYAKGSDFVVKPVFDIKKITERNIFTYKGSTATYVSEKMKQTIENGGITGIIFEKVSIA